MNDYFFTPMNEKQLEYWERRRRQGFLFYVLTRGMMFGIPMLIGFTGVDVFLQHQPFSTALMGAVFEALFWAITYKVLEWSSNQRRYRKTMEVLSRQETAKLHAIG